MPQMTRPGQGSKSSLLKGVTRAANSNSGSRTLQQQHPFPRGHPLTCALLAGGERPGKGPSGNEEGPFEFINYNQPRVGWALPLVEYLLCASFIHLHPNSVPILLTRDLRLSMQVTCSGSHKATVG